MHMSQNVDNLPLFFPPSTSASPCCGCDTIERNAQIYYARDCNVMHLNGLVRVPQLLYFFFLQAPHLLFSWALQETTFKRIF
jgi:hypothetical protein